MPSLQSPSSAQPSDLQNSGSRVSTDDPHCSRVAQYSVVPFSLPWQRDLVTQPFSGIPHRDLSNLNLHAWLLEPLSFKERDSLSKWQHELRLLRDSQLEQSTSQSGPFLCQLTSQSADIMSSLCGVGVRVRVNNFFSKTTRPRDMLFFLKDTLSIEDEKLFKACKSVCSSVC